MRRRVMGRKFAGFRGTATSEFQYSINGSTSDKATVTTDADGGFNVSLDTGGWTKMNYMFDGCSSLTSLDCSALDTSGITMTGYMFRNCSSLTSLDISCFDTSAMDSPRRMFYGCSALTNIRCTAAFRDWCISKASTISLPEAFKSASYEGWEIV